MQALARRAISLGYSAKYYRIPALLEEIKMARLDGSYTKTLAKISKFNFYCLMISVLHLLKEMKSMISLR